MIRNCRGGEPRAALRRAGAAVQAADAASRRSPCGRTTKSSRRRRAAGGRSPRRTVRSASRSIPCARAGCSRSSGSRSPPRRRCAEPPARCSPSPRWPAPSSSATSSSAPGSIPPAGPRCSSSPGSWPGRSPWRSILAPRSLAGLASALLGPRAGGTRVGGLLLLRPPVRLLLKLFDALLAPAGRDRALHASAARRSRRSRRSSARRRGEEGPERPLRSWSTASSSSPSGRPRKSWCPGRGSSACRSTPRPGSDRAPGGGRAHPDARLRGRPRPHQGHRSTPRT